jgi:hypothetical protein
MSILSGFEQHITDVSERAGWAERDAKLARSLISMQNQPRRRGLGVIRGLSASQIRVHISELGHVGGSIGVRRLRGGYTYDPVRRELIGKKGTLLIGDELSVKAEKIDPLAGVLELKIVEKGHKSGQSGNCKPVQVQVKDRRSPRGEPGGGRPRGRRGGRGQGKRQTTGQ